MATSVGGARMPVFRDRFNQLRGDMTQAQFAKFLGMSRATVGFYCSGERVPDAIILRDIAEKCKVSIDWLLGLTDAIPADEDVKIVCNYTGLSSDAVDAIHAIGEIKNTTIKIGERTETDLHEIDILSKIFEGMQSNVEFLCLLGDIRDYPQQVHKLLENVQFVLGKFDNENVPEDAYEVGKRAAVYTTLLEKIREEEYRINNASAVISEIAHDMAGKEYEMLMGYQLEIQKSLAKVRNIKRRDCVINGKDD